MFVLVLSSFLFGLSNPLAAKLLGNSDSLVFAFQFLVSMCLIQLPFVLTRWREVRAMPFEKGYSLLIVSGLIGTFLYWCEFSSYQVGLPVSHITFLMLTVPAWTLLYEWLRGRGGRTHLNKWGIALVGTAFLISPNAKGQFSLGLLLPVFTSILTAAWLIFSKRCQERGISPIVCSFFNDFFSLIGVVAFILINGRSEGLLQLPPQTLNIFFYAALTGVVPSLLLLQGLKRTNVVVASTIIMCDPVISTVLSLMINNELLGANFLIGAVFVSLSNLPEGWVGHWQQLRVSYRYVKPD